MRYTVLLDSNANTKKAESEEKLKFLRSVIECLQINPQIDEDKHLLDILDPDKGSLEPEERRLLREVFSKFDLTVVEEGDGSLHIYHERNKIAEWEKPNYVLKRDLKEVNPHKVLYLEMNISCSSVFEEAE